MPNEPGVYGGTTHRERMRIRRQRREFLAAHVGVEGRARKLDQFGLLRIA